MTGLHESPFKTAHDELYRQCTLLTTLCSTGDAVDTIVPAMEKADKRIPCRFGQKPELTVDNLLQLFFSTKIQHRSKPAEFQKILPLCVSLIRQGHFFPAQNWHNLRREAAPMRSGPDF